VQRAWQQPVRATSVQAKNRYERFGTRNDPMNCSGICQVEPYLCKPTFPNWVDHSAKNFYFTPSLNVTAVGRNPGERILDCLRARTHTMRTLIIGGTGTIGSAIAAVCKDRRLPHLITSHHDHAETTPLDVGDNDAVQELIADYQPDVTIFAAPSNEPTGISNVAQVVRKLGGSLVAFSSVAVFGAGVKAMREDDPICPEAAPGFAELERIVTAELPDRHLLIRTCTVYGADRRGPVGKLTRRFERDQAVRRDDTAIAMPTYAPDLAEVVLDLLKHSYTGTIHAVGPDRFTGFTFGRLVAHLFGYDADLVQPLAAPAVDRPGRLAIDRSRLRALLGPNALRPTAEGLRAARAELTEWSRQPVAA
jgi:dTDP-4-dehydrorhamnose reductase